MKTIYVNNTECFNALINYQHRKDTKSLYAYFLSLFGTKAREDLQKLKVISHDFRDDRLSFQTKNHVEVVVTPDIPEFAQLGELME
jgi:hypothetical protein